MWGKLNERFVIEKHKRRGGGSTESFQSGDAEMAGLRQFKRAAQSELKSHHPTHDLQSRRLPGGNWRGLAERPVTAGEGTAASREKGQSSIFEKNKAAGCKRKEASGRPSPARLNAEEEAAYALREIRLLCRLKRTPRRGVRREEKPAATLTSLPPRQTSSKKRQRN